MKVATITRLDSREFRTENQLRFAELSGDFNPIHIDAIAARRTLAGQVIVHGIHLVLWALDILVSRTAVVPAKLEVKFRKPIYVDETVECLWDELRSRLILSIGNSPMVQIHITQGRIKPLKTSSLPVEERRRLAAEPSEVDLADTRSREFCYRGMAGLAKVLLPNLCEVYGAGRVCDIAALSELVGMQLPGMDSLFATLSLKVHDADTSKMDYAVQLYEPRLRMITLQANAASLRAEMTAFVRPRATSITAIGDIAERVPSGAFKRVKALIVGGSRGLGEASAKIVACGGGEVTITYVAGRADADRVCREISEFGGSATAIHLDVTASAPKFLQYLGFNHLYYFATPKIFGKRTTTFDNNRLEYFLDYYVRGFQVLIDSIGSDRLSVFYPSTTALDDAPPELAEYVEAKRAGEDMCLSLSQNAALAIHFPRLPRIVTDQTATLLDVPAADPVDVMIPHLLALADWPTGKAAG